MTRPLPAAQIPPGRLPARRLLPGMLALALLGGCLFEPRVPESPSLGTTVTYFDQISSENVWANLGKSLEATHAPGWDNNVAPEVPDGFIYLPDSATENQYPGVFDTWNREKEIAFINAFYNSDVTITATMRNPEFQVPPDSGQEVIWENVIYDVTVTSNVDNSTTRYRGSAIITFRLNGNFWYIHQWRDLQGESDPDTGSLLSTMGVLRASFASK